MRDRPLHPPPPLDELCTNHVRFTENNLAARMTKMNEYAACLLGVRQLSFSGEKESRFICLPVLSFQPEAFCR